MRWRRWRHTHASSHEKRLCGTLDHLFHVLAAPRVTMRREKMRMIDDGIQLVCSERMYGNADEVQSRDIGCKLNNPVHHGAADVLDCLGVGDEALGKHLRFGVGNNMAKNNTRRRVAVEYIIYTYDRRHNKVFNQQLSDWKRCHTCALDVTTMSDLRCVSDVVEVARDRSGRGAAHTKQWRR